MTIWFEFSPYRFNKKGIFNLPQSIKEGDKSFLQAKQLKSVEKGDRNLVTKFKNGF